MPGDTTATFSFDIEVEGDINEKSIIEILTTNSEVVVINGFTPISGKEHRTQSFRFTNFEDDNSLSVRMSSVPENTTVTISNMKLELSDYETIYISNDTDPGYQAESYTTKLNLFKNHTFAEGLTGWTVSEGVGAKVMDDEHTPTGKAVHIISSEENLSGITQVYPYEIGKTYSITVYAKGETEGQRLRIVGANCQSVVVSLSTTYRPYTFTFTKDDRPADNIHFQKYEKTILPFGLVHRF